MKKQQTTSARQTLMGPGWRQVDTFQDINDDEYGSEEEEHVTLDLGTTFDLKSLGSDSQYQIVGLDTSTPFLKINNQIFQGSYASIIGEEIICSLIRNPEDPQNPSHLPVHKTSKRLTFSPVTLRQKESSKQPQQERLQSSQTQAGPVVSDEAPPPIGPDPPTSTVQISAASSTSIPKPGVFTARAPLRKGRQRKVIEDPSDLDGFDLDGMGPHQSVELGPRVMELLGIEPVSEGQGILINKKEMESILLGVPRTGRRGRPKKVDYFGED
ncbi:hypothetical protein L204_105790 [Cryptococcus depauperatus]